MLDLRSNGLLIGLIAFVLLARPAAAFGAGNIASISKIEGQNWRHGDIEDALLSLVMARAWNGKKFSKLNVSRVYFGNWLRDYSQAVDVGTVKAVSAEAIRLLLCVLGFLTFGFGSNEFEVTAARLGCYRPEDHIDNPKDYADNKDARQYDSRLRGPIDEGVELAIDPASGMKNYIANENVNIMTSAQHVRNLFTRCIELGRQYKDRNNKEDLYEALRLMGTGLHCLEDFFAHSNYCELALIEMGENDIFPHVGNNTRIRLDGARDEVFPIVTGTFGGVDFLHSVTGEVSDKLTQNEIDELEGALQEGKSSDTSVLRDLLDKIPSGLFGDKNQKAKLDELQSNATAAQMENTAVSPRNEEEFTAYVKNIYGQIMPAITFHDEIMKAVGSAIEKIPVLPKIVDELEEQLSKFVFSIMAPFVVPLIKQIRNELRTGSEEIIQSSEDQQHIVFNDDSSSDPTHSMLSKDHFSNILNEIAGRTAAKTLHWVVPQLMEAIDDSNSDINRLCNRIINGVMHHPAQRDMGDAGVREARVLIFDSVKQWWDCMGDGQRNEYKQKLSRDGVYKGENHKEGVQDTGHGHGCSGKLEMRKLYGEPETVETKIASAAADAIFTSASGAISNIVEQQTGIHIPGRQKTDDGEQGGLSGFLHKAGDIIKSSFRPDGEGNESGSQGQSHESYSQNSGRNDGYRPENTQSSSDYSRPERQEERPQYGGRQNENQYDNNNSYSGRQDDDNRRTGHQGGGGRRNDDDEGNYGGNQGSGGRHQGRQNEESSYGRRNEESNYGREDSGYSGQGSRRNDESNYGREDSGYSGQGSRRNDESNYGREESYGRQDSGYGGRNEGGYENRRDDDDNDDNRRDEYGSGNSGRRQQHHGRRDDQY